jgi:hypothetical protein
VEKCLINNDGCQIVPETVTVGDAVYTNY